MHDHLFFTSFLNYSGKRYKGVPVAWDEVKQNRTIMLTPTAWEILNEKATEMQISRSEVLERLIKGQIAFVAESESGKA